MKMIYHQVGELFSLANKIASDALNRLKHAGKANADKKYFDHKSKIMRDFLLTSPVMAFVIMYVLLLGFDAFFMYPIIALTVRHGMMLQDDMYVILFIMVYVVIVAALTLGAAHGFAKLIDKKLHDLQVELELVSSPGVSKSYISDQVHKDTSRDTFFGILFSVFLFALLICLSLYRNYITNDFHLTFNSPDDWLNILWPLIFGAALIFFGIYKDTIIRKLSFESNARQAERVEEHELKAYKDLAQQAINQEMQAKHSGDDGTPSADLKRIKQLSEVNYEELYNVKFLQVYITVGGIPASGVQVTAYTDTDTLFSVTDYEGSALISWCSENEVINRLYAGGIELPGNGWKEGSIVKYNISEYQRVLLT